MMQADASINDFFFPQKKKKLKQKSKRDSLATFSQ